MKSVNQLPTGATLQGYSTVPATSDAKEYLRLLLKHKLGLFTMLMLGILLAILYLISATPVYKAASLLEVKEAENPTIGDSRASAPVDFNKPTVKEEANILRSQKVLAPVVELYNLRKEIEPKRIPVVADITQRVPALADWLRRFSFAQPYAWGDEQLEISRLEVPSEWEDTSMTITALGNGFYDLAMEGQTIIANAEVGESVQIDLQNVNPLHIVVTRLDASPGVTFSVVKKSLQETLGELQKQLQVETSDLKSRMLTVTLEGEDALRTTEIQNARDRRNRSARS